MAASSASSSLEMSAEQLATRIIAERTGIPSSHDPPRRHHRGRLREDQATSRSSCRACRSIVDETGGLADRAT